MIIGNFSLKKFFTIFIFFYLFSTNAYSGEITDLEWDDNEYLQRLNVTYYDAIISNRTKVECVAYRTDTKKPIGGGWSYGEGGGIAIVNIKVPKKYYGKSGTSARCSIFK